ncbi:unnamed protein product [Closterium sp. NIES-65]|nr:unnamed protein product [Closterium sp. NIES-65]
MARGRRAHGTSVAFVSTQALLALTLALLLLRSYISRQAAPSQAWSALFPWGCALSASQAGVAARLVVGRAGEVAIGEGAGGWGDTAAASGSVDPDAAGVGASEQRGAGSSGGEAPGEAGGAGRLVEQQGRPSIKEESAGAAGGGDQPAHSAAVGAAAVGVTDGASTAIGVLDGAIPTVDASNGSMSAASNGSEAGVSSVAAELAEHAACEGAALTEEDVRAWQAEEHVAFGHVEVEGGVEGKGVEGGQGGVAEARVNEEVCFTVRGEWGQCVASGGNVWPVGAMCGQWGLCVASGGNVWPVGAMCGQWGLCVASGGCGGTGKSLLAPARQRAFLVALVALQRRQGSTDARTDAHKGGSGSGSNSSGSSADSWVQGSARVTEVPVAVSAQARAAAGRAAVLLEEWEQGAERGQGGQGEDGVKGEKGEGGEEGAGADVRMAARVTYHPGNSTHQVNTHASLPPTRPSHPRVPPTHASLPPTRPSHPRVPPTHVSLPPTRPSHPRVPPTHAPVHLAPHHSRAPRPPSLGPHATCASISPAPPLPALSLPVCYQLPLPGRYVLSLHLLFSATFPLLRSNARTSFLGGFSNYTVVQSQAIQASAPPTFSLHAHRATLPYCTPPLLTASHHSGYWMGHLWQPHACRLRRLSPPALHACFKGRSLLFLGDSQLRYTFGFLRLLLRFPSRAAFLTKFAAKPKMFWPNMLACGSVPRGNGSIYPPINSSTGELISTGVCQQPDSAFFFHGENFNGYGRALYKVRAAEGRPAAAFNLTYVSQCGAMKPVLPAWMSDPALVGPTLALFNARGSDGSADAPNNSTGGSSSSSSSNSSSSGEGSSSGIRGGGQGEYDMALVGTTLHDLIQQPTAKAFGALLESNLLSPLLAVMRDRAAVALLGPWAAREDSKPPEFIPVSNNARAVAFEEELLRRLPSTQPGAASALGMMGLTLPRPDLCPDSTHYAWPVTLTILDLWLTPLCAPHASHAPEL